MTQDATQIHLNTPNNTGSFSSQINAVAICRTPYKQKFGIPRQPGLVKATGYIEFEPAFNHIDAIRGIEQYSHLWLLFCFHENLAQGWKTTVRPPRLGGNEKLGVFATRSTFRPNGIGQSVVKLHGIVNRKGKVCLAISGMDLLDGTPIIDIKPYIPFSDAILDAKGGIAQQAPELIAVHYTELAKTQIAQYGTQAQYQDLMELINGVLSQDPRPAYKKAKDDPKLYQVALYDLDIFWHITSHGIEVLELKPTKVFLLKD
ncbi:tRNA (N6-threonylcarbamoyladenosine(37)-N6)-methyltransferase TrmO [Shewanella inventionis]|uniref:tRNA (N6-threonylcarbamoyladenosine(37)-N6)-methyltransferase TrmO n=1 Tax=Shewanella inventionis TaxID=1738770 RepID=A0ABQ1IR22_9GAMM|nr:tRNA (N6-threonylcarbamoyladenosine(37)-N6)-methyltransferase TrmO [Shewanella inventionis]MCL1157739.1 tRNA (N6-threonylcarbamoyladenosine(37)-N6)-methyltransferase TrmO [Shewanella inventionis]UAL42516.1 tRNA (N6-threonylcarbamoyladenosine(37)-N6)-methyltransferase TrmO [Shewanella inventionis]GGB48003.1 tRNA (N6-threonylcarbamoyladenosine(37)-N6)-methyltransferase TrmO [Shewanella inventionis]